MSNKQFSPSDFIMLSYQRDVWVPLTNNNNKKINKFKRLSMLNVKRLLQSDLFICFATEITGASYRIRRF